MYRHDMGGTTPQHTAVWSATGWTSSSGHNNLPLCNGMDSQTEDYPIYNDASGISQGWTYQCGTVAKAGGNPLPAIITYMTVEQTVSSVSWGPTKICKKMNVGTAIGVAMAYSAYIEMGFAAIIILGLYSCGVVKLSTKFSMGDWANTFLEGEGAGNQAVKAAVQKQAATIEALQRRLGELEQKASSQ